MSVVGGVELRCVGSEPRAQCWRAKPSKVAASMHESWRSGLGKAAGSTMVAWSVEYLDVEFAEVRNVI
jgi:hypothetical protein